LREAKVHTSWINVNEPYERGCDQFLRRLLAGDRATNPFLADLCRFVGGIATAGLCNALAQLVLKLTVPGVPDLYQGTELWDFTLVDPDNRRPVDYTERRSVLDALRGLEGDALRARIAAARGRPTDGALKLLVAARTLAHRRRHRQLFETGAYLPLPVEGPHAHHVLAFARVAPGRPASITIVGRFFAALEATGRSTGTSVFKETRVRLPDDLLADAYREIISDTTVAVQPDRRSELPLAGILSMLPAAVLEPIRQ
jgi:(1->4)-alpha-D-glucan 1-alpha-D-glucosylmutase